MIVDSNKHYVTLASDGTKAVPLKVDPVTGRLLAKIVKSTSTGSEICRAKIDENKVSSAIAEDISGNIKPLIIDATNNYLFIDNG